MIIKFTSKTIGSENEYETIYPCYPGTHLDFEINSDCSGVHQQMILSAQITGLRFDQDICAEIILDAVDVTCIEKRICESTLHCKDCCFGPEARRQMEWHQRL